MREIGLSGPPGRFGFGDNRVYSSEIGYLCGAALLSPAQYLDRFGAEVVCSVYREDNLIEERVFKLEREASEEVRFETLLEEGEKLYFEVAAKNGNSHCFLSDEIELRIER